MNVTREALRVFVSSRFGRGRVRVTECIYTLKAEAIYDQMLRAGRPPSAGGCSGQVLITVAGRSLAADWVSVPNPIWTHGRVFLRCARCGGRCTRLYLPLRHAALECRTCYGLTYTSRGRGNYHRSGGLLTGLMGVSPGDWEKMWTWERRQEARMAARVRYRERRASVRSLSG